MDNKIEIKNDYNNWNVFVNKANVETFKYESDAKTFVEGIAYGYKLKESEL